MQASTRIINILAESKDQLETNIFEMHGIFAFFNERLEIIDANQELEQIYPKQICFRENIIDSILPEYQEEAKNQIQKTAQDGEIRSFESKLHNGKLYIMTVSQVACPRKEEKALLKISGTDISELRDLESQIVDVLRTINLGVIFVDENNCIMPGYSDYTHTIFEQNDLVGKNVHDLIFNQALNKFSQDTLQVIDSLKDFSNQDELFFKVISLTMPPKIELPSSLQESGSKIIKFSFEPIIEDGKVLKYLIIAQDVTELERSRPVKFCEDMKALIDSFEKDSQGTLDTIRDLKALVDRLPEYLDPCVSDEVKGVLHSLKGMLGMNDMKYMARLIHDVETYIKPEEFVNNKELVEYNMIDFIHCYHKITMILETIDDSDKNNSSKSLLNKSELLSQLPDEARLHPFLSKKYFEKDESLVNVLTVEDSAAALIERNSMTFETFAELDCNLEEATLIQDSFQAVKTSLIHMINNSFAHGFESGSDDCIIKVTSKVLGNKYQVTYSDNGMGVNIPKMREKLIESGEDASKISALSDQEVADSVFKAGISTKDEVSEIAGRGVGLAGVYLDVLRLGGSLTLDEFRSGCQFTLTLPISDKKPESAVVAKDILEHAINLFLGGEEQYIEIPYGMYAIKDTQKLYDALLGLEALDLEKVLIQCTKDPKLAGPEKILKKFQENNIVVFIEDNSAVICLSGCLIDISSLHYPKELFGCSRAYQVARAKCKNILGQKLDEVGESFSEEDAIFYYNPADESLSPSLIRLLEQKLYLKHF